MPYTPKRLYIGQPGTTLGTLFAVPANTKVIVTNILLCNTATTTVKVTLHFVPNGSSASNANKIIADYPVSANDTVVIDDLSVVLETGDTIQAVQDTANAVTVYVSGVEVQ